MRLDLDLIGWWLGHDLERWWTVVSGHDTWWSAVIMWCWMVGTVWVWGGWVGSDRWCCGGRWFLGHTIVAIGGLILFWIFFYLGQFEVWCLMIGWLSWSCLIVLCDVGINWVDLGLIIWCSEIFVFFSFLNVM